MSTIPVDRAEAIVRQVMEPFFDGPAFKSKRGQICPARSAVDHIVHLLKQEAGAHAGGAMRKRNEARSEG